MTKIKRNYQDMTDGELAHLIDTEHVGIYAYPLPDSERGELTKEMKAIKENFKKRHIKVFMHTLTILMNG